MKATTTQSPESNANTLAMIICLYPQAFALATHCDSRTGRALQRWSETDLLPPCPPSSGAHAGEIIARTSPDPFAAHQSGNGAAKATSPEGS